MGELQNSQKSCVQKVQIFLQKRPGIEFLGVVIGIYSSYLYFGYLQQQLQKLHRYNQEKPFSQPQSVVFVQALMGFLISKLCIKFFVQEKPKIQPGLDFIQKFPPVSLQLYHSACQTFSMFLTNTALTYISFPVQALAKSCKIVPVMIGGCLGRKKVYKVDQIISALLVVGGTLGFNYMKTNQTGPDSSSIGLIMIFGALMLDAVNGFASEKARLEYKVSSLQMMNYCNFYGMIFTLVLMLLSLGEDRLGYFLSVYSVGGQLLLIGFASAVGQVFVFRAISTFGVLTLNIITTTRKILAIVFSIIIFNHAVNSYQYFFLLIAISGAGIDFYQSTSKNRLETTPHIKSTKLKAEKP